MDPTALKKLLEEVARGDVDPQSALECLRHLPISEVPEAQATLDTHRALRTGYPEVVLGSSKTPEQIIAIARRMLELEQTVLVTRIDPPVADRLLHALGEGEYDPLGRTYIARRGPAQEPRGKLVLVITAGTSDTPVAQEALVTARVMGANVERIDDVGVAGLHRITRHTERLQHAGVLVVVAGMDGALPSVVAGLSGRPVVAVHGATRTAHPDRGRSCQPRLCRPRGCRSLVVGRVRSSDGAVSFEYIASTRRHKS